MKQILYFIGAGLSKALSAPEQPIPAMFDFIQVMADYIVENGPHNDVVLANLINLELAQPYPYEWTSAEATIAARKLQESRAAQQTSPRPPYPNHLRRAFRDALRRRPAESVEDILGRANAPAGNYHSQTTGIRFAYAINSLFALIKWNLNWEPLLAFLRGQFALPDTFHTFVSFNYDLILDRGLQMLCEGEGFAQFDASSCYGFPIHYSVTGGEWNAQEMMRGGGSSVFTILKPHGSLNWLVPTHGMIETYEEDENMVILRIGADRDLTYACDPSQNFNLINLPNGKGYDWEPYIVPPLAAKRSERDFTCAVVRQEQDAIQNADQVYILGWSMPKSDGEQERLIAQSAASRAKPIDNVTVVNYGAAPHYFQRLADAFNVRPEQLRTYNAGFIDFASQLSTGAPS